MAKQIGIFPFSGKLDTAVGMKGEDGKNFFRKLVTPKNPNTDAQVMQRSKMALAGLLSKITPVSAIYGMGASNRKRRSAYTGNIASNATSTVAAGVVTTNLAPADLVFSKGVARDLKSIITLEFVDNNLTAVCNDMPEDLAAIKVIAVFSQNRTGDYNEVAVQAITAETETVHFENASAIANVYYVPVFKATSASRAKYDDAVAAIEATHDYSVQADILTSGVFTDGQSMYHSSMVNTQG